LQGIDGSVPVGAAGQSRQNPVLMTQLRYKAVEQKTLSSP
jgi:hypothetical protein